MFSQEEIQTWLVSYIANELKVDAGKIKTTVPYDRYGLDSTATVGMVADLEDWLGRTLPPTLVYDYPTIQSLAQHLSSSIQIEASPSK